MAPIFSVHPGSHDEAKHFAKKCGQPVPYSVRQNHLFYLNAIQGMRHDGIPVSCGVVGCSVCTALKSPYVAEIALLAHEPVEGADRFLVYAAMRACAALGYHFVVTQISSPAFADWDRDGKYRVMRFRDRRPAKSDVLEIVDDMPRISVDTRLLT